MTFLRKLVLTVVTAVALAAPMTVTAPKAEAQHGGHHRHYTVYYRYDPASSWARYGTYHTHEHAHRVAHHLRQHYRVEAFVR